MAAGNLHSLLASLVSVLERLGKVRHHAEFLTLLLGSFLGEGEAG
jgi:hypothetical protein